MTVARPPVYSTSATEDNERSASAQQEVAARLHAARASSPAAVSRYGGGSESAAIKNWAVRFWKGANRQPTSFRWASCG
jgi:hypothetical protein